MALSDIAALTRLSTVDQQQHVNRIACQLFALAGDHITDVNVRLQLQSLAVQLGEQVDGMAAANYELVAGLHAAAAMVETVREQRDTAERRALDLERKLELLEWDIEARDTANPLIDDLVKAIRDERDVTPNDELMDVIAMRWREAFESAGHTLTGKEIGALLEGLYDNALNQETVDYLADVVRWVAANRHPR